MLALVSLPLIIVVVPAVIAVVLGIVALRKIKREAAAKGRGLAIAGVIIGSLAALGGIALDIAIGVGVSDSTTYEDLRPGDCLEDPGDRVFLIDEQSCSRAHERQVFAVLDDPASSSAPYPGSTAIRAKAETECVGRFSRLSGVPDRSELRVYYLVPGRDSWEDDDNRRIICMVGNRDDSPLIGSLPGLD